MNNTYDRLETLWKACVRKARNFAADPIGTSLNQPQRIRAVLGRWHLEKNGVMDVMRAFQWGRPAGAVPGDPGDWWFLYKTIRARKPQLIVEFGSGNTTVVQGQALYDNDTGGHLVSIESSEFWRDSTDACLPQHLRTVCEVIHGPLIEVEAYGTQGWRHSNVPHVAPNFVYLDGPRLTPERQVAVDLLDMEMTFPPDFFLVIDDRKANTLFLKEHFRRHYRYTRRTYLGMNPTFELIR